MSKKNSEIENSPVDSDERRDARHKRRIRNQVFAYLILLLIIGGIGAGGYFGVGYLASMIKNTQANKPVEEEVVSDNSVSDDELSPVISSPEEFVEDEPIVEEEPAEPENEQARAYVDSMELEQKVANLFIVHPEGVMEGVEIEDCYGQKTGEAIETYAVGAFIYSDKNKTSTEDNFIKLLSDTREHYQKTYNVPLWVLYEGEDAINYHDKGVDFFISNADSYEGPIATEISTVGKFPMQDGSDAESVEESLEDMQTQRFPYFETAIASDVDAIILSNVFAPNASGDGLPCSLSYAIITETLRGSLGFKGIIITDYLNQPAVTGKYSSGEAAVMAINAGADMLLCPDNFLEAYDAVLTAVQSGDISEDRIDESLIRIFTVKYERQQ